MNAMIEDRTGDLTRRLAEFSASFDLAAAPERVRENAKLVILDCIGVSVLATSNELWDALGRFARAHAAPGPCRVWGSAVTASMRDAAFMNATLAHGLDFDDRNHSSTYTLAAAMAVAEEHDKAGAALLESFIVGREVRNALDPLFASRASGIGPGARGWHSNGVLGAIAAACSAAHGLGLDAETTQRAIGLAAGACGALTRDGGTMAKPFRCGNAAATGLTTALLAESGFSSDAQVLEGRYGLLEALGPIPEELLDRLGRGLGVSFHLATGIAVKSFSSCSATHEALEAIFRMLETTPIAPEQVERIETHLRPYPCLRFSPTRGYEGRFSIPFCLAVAIVRGRFLPGDVSDDNARDPMIRDLVARARHDEATEGVTVILKDGTRLFEPFQPRASLTARADIEAKFRRSVDGVLAPDQAETALDAVMALDTLPRARTLGDALAGTEPGAAAARAAAGE